jgi:hypothetical protein
MNLQERDDLRAKHCVGQNEADDQCQSCYSPDGYPCDVIKVLDAWDQRTNGLVSPAQTNTGIPYVDGYQGRQGTQGAWNGEKL